MSLLYLARNLRTDFQAARLAPTFYPTQLEHVVRILAARLDTSEYAIGHSLGGLLMIDALTNVARPPKRILLLGSPVAGSACAGRLAQIPGGEVLLRAASRRLQSATVIPGVPPVGQIAGTLPFGAGRLLRSGAQSDGTVLLSETRDDRLAAHTTVATSHSGLLASRAVVQQARRFLLEGRFA